MLQIPQVQIEKKKSCSMDVTLLERKLLVRIRQEFNRTGKVIALVEKTSESFTIRFVGQLEELQF